MSTEQERGFNGWSNYETWVVAVWLDNEEDTYFLWRENAKKAVIQVLDDDPDLRHNHPELLQKAVLSLSGQMIDWLEDKNPLNDQANMFTDLLNAALAEINYLEIAKHFLDEEIIDSALQEWESENSSEV